MKEDNFDITVCICTYKRPLLLYDLLINLQKQITYNNFVFNVVIVDNDIEQSAENVVNQYKRGFDVLDVCYYNEKEQNISLARNRAVKEAVGEYIALIDDDEIPENSWLISLYCKCTELKADGILGPVIPKYTINPPKWILEGKFYDRPRHKTGYLLDYMDTRTGNVLIKKQLFALDMFDPKLGSGGEDKDLFRRLIAKGYKFYWNDRAIVYEIIPPSRMKRSFLLKRALLRGKMAVYNPLFSNTDIIKSVAAIAVYILIIPFSLIFGHHIFLKYLIKSFDHIGKIFTYMNLDLVPKKYISE